MLRSLLSQVDVGGIVSGSLSAGNVSDGSEKSNLCQGSRVGDVKIGYKRR